MFVSVPGIVENSRKAILITGGWGRNEQAAEVFLPWSNTTCGLPSLPDRRVGHVQSGNTLCGGGFSSFTLLSCLQWRQGGWIKLPVSLAEARYHSSARKVEEGLVIMGGQDSWRWIEGGLESWPGELVSSDGANSVRLFNMKRPIW